jgi:hypothetical protein
MTSQALESVASMPAAEENGVLATGETVPRLTTRLEQSGALNGTAPALRETSRPASAVGSVQTWRQVSEHAGDLEATSPKG